MMALSNMVSNRLAVVVLLFVVVLVTAGVFSPDFQSYMAARRGMKALEGQSLPNSWEHDFPENGVFIPLNDGSWIAIYSESDSSFSTWTISLALDSEGRRYQSHRAFRTRFRIFRILRDRDSRMLTKGEATGGQVEQVQEQSGCWPSEIQEIFDLAASKSLDAARRRLREMGFVEGW